MPVASSAPPAPHLAVDHRNRPITFADIIEQDFADDAFEGMPHDWQPARGSDELDHDAVVVATLDELRADIDDRPVHPDALSRAFNPTTWLPSTIGLRAVRVASVPVDEIETVIADILAHVAAAPFVRHEDALRMVLAPLAAMLAENEPRTDWSGEISDRVGLGLVKLDRVEVAVTREANTANGMIALWNRHAAVRNAEVTAR